MLYNVKIIYFELKIIIHETTTEIATWARRCVSVLKHARAHAGSLTDASTHTHANQHENSH